MTLTAEPASPEVDPLNPFIQPGLQLDPHAEYRKLREVDPLHHVVGLGWVAVGYEDCRELLKSDDTRQADPNEWQPDFGLPGIEELQGTVREWIGMSNPPDHRRRRSLCDQAFKRKTVLSLQTIVDECIDELLTAAERAGQFDIVRDLAYPLPANVICSLLGVPAADRDLLRGWSRDVSVTYDPVITSDDVRRGIQAAQETQRYLQGLIAQRRADPRDDLLTGFAHARENGHALTPHEIAANALLVFLAGHQTTTGALGGGILALYRERNRRQLAVVRAGGEDILPTTVEEIMRHSGPVHTIWRVANHDFERSGRQIKRGDLICAVLAGANRDPSVYPDPDAFDVTRVAPAPHLGFGWGAHFCLGAHLARLEITSALRAVLRRLPNLQLLDEAPQPTSRITSRGPASLSAVF